MPLNKLTDNNNNNNNNNNVYAVIIPSLNPDNNLVNLVDAVCKKDQSMEIIVVDDGSLPGFQQVFHKLKIYEKCTLIHNKKNCGKGASLKTGINYVLKNFPNCMGIITADSDGQHHPDDIEKIKKAIEENPSSIILGIRDFTMENVPFKSRYGNKITSSIFKMVSGYHCADTQTGLRGIPAKHLKNAISVEGSRYDYEMNFLLQLSMLQVSIVEIPVETIYNNKNKGTHFHPIKDSFRIYKVIFKYFISTLNKRTKKQIHLRFIISSLLSFLIDISLFTIFKNAFKINIDFSIFISTIIARIMSGVFNFTINRKWVFREKGILSHQSLGYILLFFTQMILSGVLTSLLSFSSLPTTLIKGTVDLLLFFVSFFVQRKFIFKKGDKLKGGDRL